MGTSRTSGELTAKLGRLSKDLSQTRRPLTVTAFAGKQIFAASAQAAGAARLARARYDIQGDRAVIRYRGAKAHLVNNDTKPHRIGPRRRGRRAIAFNAGDGGVRLFADHPGTTGKRFFQAARSIAARELPKVYNRAAVTDPLRRIFG